MIQLLFVIVLNVILNSIIQLLFVIVSNVILNTMLLLNIRVDANQLRVRNFMLMMLWS